MAIRPPKYNSQGFTLVEILVTLLVIGIVVGIAVPSLLTINKPLRNGSLQFKGQLALIRSKAIASSQAYRIRPKFTTRGSYPNGIPNKFVVEYAANCRITTNGGTNGWAGASQLDLNLPENIGITAEPSSTFTTVSGTFTTTDSLNWNICFDNRGIIALASEKRFVLKDFQGFSQAEIALFDITTVGGVDLYTYKKQSGSSYPITAELNYGQPPTSNPVF